MLNSLGHIDIDEHASLDGISYCRIKLNQSANLGHLSDRENMDIKNILSPLIHRELNDVLDITYNTKEYKETPFGEVISL